MILVSVVMVNTRHENVAVRDQGIGYGFGQRIIVERLSIRRLRHYGKISLSNWAEAKRRDDIPGEMLPRSYAGSGLTRGAGIARHVNGDHIALAVLPVREIPASLQDRRNRESGHIRAAGLVKGFPVKIEKGMVLGGPMVKERYLDRAAEVSAKVMLIVDGTLVGTSWICRGTYRIPGSRIEHPVAGVLKCCSVILVPARLAHHGDLPRRR